MLRLLPLGNSGNTTLHVDCAQSRKPNHTDILVWGQMQRVVFILGTSTGFCFAYNTAYFISQQKAVIYSSVHVAGL